MTLTLQQPQTKIATPIQAVTRQPTGMMGLAFLGFCAVIFSSMAMRTPWGANSNPLCTFSAMLDGSADAPFVTRVLLPKTLQGIGGLVSDGLRGDLDEALTPRHPATRVLNNLAEGWERELAVEYLAYIMITFGCMLGFACAVRSLMTSLVRPPRCMETVVPLVAMACVPTFVRPYGMYIYDIPLLCLYTWALALMSRQSWKPYFVVFFLACLNKETTLLLIVVFCVHHWPQLKARQPLAMKLLGLHVLLYLGTRLPISWIYADSPTELVQHHLVRNLFLFPHYTLGTVILLMALVATVLRRWRSKPPFLRAALAPAIPLAVLGFIFGFFDELRDYLELVPVVLLLILPTVCEYADVPLE